MRAIIVDDEPVMVKYFVKECECFQDLNIKACFNSAQDALDYAKKNPVDVAFLDVEMPDMTGLELANRLREMYPDILITFVSAYDYIRASNRMGGDYYLEKPYDRQMLEHMMDKLRLLAQRQHKRVRLQMFGRFTVTVDGAPVPLRGKAKEILAFVALHRGKEVSNQEIYMTLWGDDRPYDAKEMTTYFHALKRLKKGLLESGIDDLLISNVKGQMLNIDMVDCDYYSWLDDNSQPHERFNGVFLSEYSWSEETLAEMVYDV